MNTIKKAETLAIFQEFAIYSQLVSQLGVEILNPRNDTRDPENEITKEYIESFKVASEKSADLLQKIKNFDVV